MRAILAGLILAVVAFEARAQTIATFTFHRIGSIELELFDDKPITVSNFIKYANSGRYENQLIHRWVPGFVIQGGGYRVDTSNPQQYQIAPVQVFGTITNEARVGTFRSNTYGTIAMARVGGQTNSATSQWFINLKDNGGAPANLDTVDNGFTVFGRIISGTNVLDRFFPPPPANQIYISETAIGPMAILTTNELTWNDLVYVGLTFRRDMNLSVAHTVAGQQITWLSMEGVTNAVQTSTTLTNWTTLTNILGNGRPIQVTDTSRDPHRFYRISGLY